MSEPLKTNHGLIPSLTFKIDNQAQSPYETKTTIKAQLKLLKTKSNVLQCTKRKVVMSYTTIETRKKKVKWNMIS